MSLPATVSDYPWPLDARAYDAEWLRMVQESLGFREGIAPHQTSELTGTTISGQWKASTGGSGLNVSVAAGRAFVQGDGRSTQGLYYCYSNATQTVTLPANASGNPRIDAVILQVDDADVSGANNRWRATYQQGTATVGATLTNLTGAPGQSGGPALQATAMVLAYVLVPNGFAGPFVDATHILDWRNLADPRSSGAKIYRTAALSQTATGTYQAVTFDTVDYDNDRYVDVAGVNSKLYARQSGLYHVEAQAVFSNNVTGYRAISVTKNGAAHSADNVAGVNLIPTLQNLAVSMSCSSNVELAAGDYIEMTCFQNSGGNLAYVVGRGSINLSMNRIA